MISKTISINNKNIAYKIYGEGKPVLLLHGFGEDSSVWHNQIAFLENDYRLIVPDLPGSGASPLTDDVSMEGIADTVKQIVEKEEIEKFILIGHSMGGYATLAFAEKFSQMLTGFGLFHSSAYADSQEKIETRKKGIEFIKEHGALAFLKTAIPNLFSDTTKEQNPGIVDAFIKSLPDFSNEALIAYYEAMIARPDRTAILSATTLPILFIMGAHDKAVPYEDALKQSALPSVSYINILYNSGHMGMLEETEKANQALKTFLDEV